MNLNAITGVMLFCYPRTMPVPTIDCTECQHTELNPRKLCVQHTRERRAMLNRMRVRKSRGQDPVGGAKLDAAQAQQLLGLMLQIRDIQNQLPKQWEWAGEQARPVQDLLAAVVELRRFLRPVLEPVVKARRLT